MKNVKRNLILGYPRGENKWRGLANALESLDQETTIVTSDFDNIDGTYDQVWTMAESLLPLQAELEKKYGIDNLSQQAADILSNKKKMDDFCVDNGLEYLIPKSIIATSSSDLDIFKNTPFIVKPVVGSGCKKNYDTDIAYCSYKTKNDFMIDTYSDIVFRINQLGWVDSMFNNRINHYMFQEHLYHNKFYTPYVYVNEYGDISFLFYIVGNLVQTQIDEYRFQSRPNDFMMIDERDIPSKCLSAMHIYHETIVEELELKSLFFAGPDFYYDNYLQIKVIDCNPRIGQGLQILNEIHGNQYLPSILKKDIIDLTVKFWWVQAELKPGKIKEVKDFSHLSEYLLSTNPNINAGDIVPEYVYPADDVPRIGLKIPGKDKTDMLNTYRSVNQQILDCIVYED